ncbi:hypothetical protein AB6A40_004905, partial [Gnathostoma spinigerum]
ILYWLDRLVYSVRYLITMCQCCGTSPQHCFPIAQRAPLESIFAHNQLLPLFTVRRFFSGMKPRLVLRLIATYIVTECVADFCGDNKIPFGFEVHRNGQLSLLCSKPNCFERKFAECEDSAKRRSCSTDEWVGGITKDYGPHQPLYVQCCMFENFDKISQPLHDNIPIHAGEYYEGEEQVDRTTNALISFDIIANVIMVHNINGTHSYELTVRRVYCADLPPHQKIMKLSKWP